MVKLSCYVLSWFCLFNFRLEAKSVDETKALEASSVEALLLQSIDPNIYNLDSVLTNPDFKKLNTEKERSNFLEKALEKKKNLKIKKAAAINTLWKSPAMAAVFYWIYSQFLDPYKDRLLRFEQNGGISVIETGEARNNLTRLFFPLEEEKSLEKRMMLLGGVTLNGFIIWVAFRWITGYDLLANTRQGLESSMFFAGLKKIEDVYKEVDRAYARKYYLLKTKNPSLLAEVKAKMIQMRKDSIDAFMHYEGFIANATNVPLVRAEYKFDKDTFDRLFKYTSEKNRKELEAIAMRMAKQSRDQKDPGTIFPVFFSGAPGTGKTFSASSIAQSVGSSIARITLDGATIEDVIGTPHSKSAEAKPGRLLLALTAMANNKKETNFENSILFIDEFDRLTNSDDRASRALLSYMLKLLDPTNRKFFSPYLNAEIKIPSMIILAGNYDIKDPALRNRFQVINFDHFDDATKKLIVYEKIVPEICKDYKTNVNSLTSNDWKEIDNLIENSTPDGGLRTVHLNIILYMERTFANRIIKDLDSF